MNGGPASVWAPRALRRLPRVRRQPSSPPPDPRHHGSLDGREPVERPLRHRRVRLEGRPQPSSCPTRPTTFGSVGRWIWPAVKAATPSGWPSRAGRSPAWTSPTSASTRPAAWPTERGVDVEWICADATTWQPPADGFDLVAVFYLQLPADERRRAMRVAGRALAPERHPPRRRPRPDQPHRRNRRTPGPGRALPPRRRHRRPAAAGIDLTVERAETVERPVPGADRPALDCLVRARRSA